MVFGHICDQKLDQSMAEITQRLKQHGEKKLAFTARAAASATVTGAVQAGLEKPGRASVWRSQGEDGRNLKPSTMEL